MSSTEAQALADALDIDATRGTGEVVSFQPDADQPLRIAILSYRSNPHSGGQGIYIKHLTKALVDLGHEVTVISGEPYPHIDPRVKLVKIPGVDLYSRKYPIAWPGRRIFQSWINFGEYLSHVTGGFVEPITYGKRLRKYLDKHAHEYDIFHDNQCLCYELLDLQEKGVPVLATIHHPITRDRDIALANTDSFRLKLLIKRWHVFLNMQTHVARNLKSIITVSESSKRDIAQDFDSNPRAIQNVYIGIDLDEFYPVDGVTRKTNRLMVTTSSDIPMKGLRVLLNAMAKLVKTRPDLELVVIGKPNKKAKTMKFIRTLGLDKHIRFESQISAERFRELYAETTIAIVPSLYEGFGLPAGEAMACGVPVVSTTGGALPEVVGDAGVLVEPGDAHALAEAIDELLDDPARREDLAKRGRERILDNFTWRKIAENTVTVYRQIIGGKHNADR